LPQAPRQAPSKTGPLGLIRRFLRRLFPPPLKKGPPLVAPSVPVPESEGVPVFESLSDIFHTSRAAFLKVLRRIRRGQEGRGRGGGRRVSVRSSRLGRNTRPVPYRVGENTFAPRLTLLRSLQRQRWRPGPPRQYLRRSDFMGWTKADRQSLTLVLVVDTSRSIRLYVEVFRQILKSMTGHFNRKQDRISLIGLQGAQARILNHPTHNHRVVLNRLAKLQIHGESPLADGLLKALETVKLERFKNPSSRSLVTVLSDCYPEPLTGDFPDVFDEPAYREAMRVAGLYRRARVNLLVIHPLCASPRLVEAGRVGPGERLAEKIAALSGGRLVKIEERDGRERMSRREMAGILQGMEAMLHGQGKDRAASPFSIGNGSPGA
jgi:Mg-chelatase subunit ChlD